MSTYKRVNGDYTIQTLGANTITFAGNVANAVTVVVDGNFTVTGNATLTGNISGDKLFNGTTSIEIPAANGNANVTVGGTSNVAVFTTTGLNISGVASVSGNIVGGNLNTAGLVSATGNINGGNVNTAGNVTITRDASVSQPTIRFADTDTTGTAGTVLGAVEWFTSDVTAAGVTAAIRATLVDTGGNSNVQILTGTPGSLAARVTVLHTGNVGVANAAPDTTIGVTGTAYISGNTTVAANISGGNISTAGLIAATGNITGGNINTAGLVTATGNITGGNIITAGTISAGAAGITATGNIRGGNLVSDAAITATGSIASGASITAQDQISAQGNVIANNISAGNIINTGILNATSNVSATGNVTGSNLVTGGAVTAVGAVTGGSITTGGLITATGNITTSAFFVGDGGFLSNVTAISNVTTSQITNGTTVMAVAGPNGNIFATVNAVGNILVLSDTGAFVTGTLSATGNVTGANVNTAGLVSATGNVNGGNVNGGIGNFTTVIGAANASSLTSGTVSADRLSGSYVINVTGNVSGTAATVTNGAQANITSVGTLTSLSVSGNINTGGVFSATGNITGGNVSTGALSLSGNVLSAINTTSAITTTANITGGNILGGANVNATTHTGTTVSVTGNITGGNLITAGLVSAGTTISATGNITGGNLITAGLITATGNISATANISGGNIRTTGTTNTVGLIASGTISASGSISGADLLLVDGVANIGGFIIDSSATPTGPTFMSGPGGNLEIVGNVSADRLTSAGNITGGNLITSGTTGILSVNSITHTGTNAVGNIGSASSYFNQVFATATTALYADLAEKYAADADYEPGTVVSFGGTAEVTASVVSADRKIAGVVSANPSYLMNAGLESAHTVVVALQGRVPCKVVGTVQKGDMMISAGNGRAQACENPLVGSVIGKALENFDGVEGTIEVVVGRI
jgi:filamentous hemagglutinin